MDAYNTDVRPLLAELRAEQGVRPGPDGGLHRLWLRREDRRRTGRRPAGRVGSMSTEGRAKGVVGELIARSNRLGSDPRNTNYAEATPRPRAPLPIRSPARTWSCYGSRARAVTWPPDPAGLAALRLDRLRALASVYPGVDREDEMVAAFDYCLHGKGGAAPSIDTAMRGLVGAAHVDHLHPDSGIAIATAVDGEAPDKKKIFGDTVRVVAVAPSGFQLGLDIATIKDANPQAIGCILGGHGITAWGNS